MTTTRSTVTALSVSTNLSEGETDLTLDLGLLRPATIVVEKIIDPSTDDDVRVHR